MLYSHELRNTLRTENGSLNCVYTKRMEMWNITNASWVSREIKDPLMTMEDLSSPIVESELSGLEYIPGILQVK